MKLRKLKFFKEKLITRIAPLQSTYRYALTLLVIGLIVASWLYGLYYPFQRSREEQERQLSMIHKKYQQLELAKQEVKELQVDVANLEKEVNACKVVNGSHDYMQSQVTYVLQQIQQCGLTLQSYNTGKEITRDWCLARTAQFDLVGSMPQILEFLNHIKTCERMIECPNLSVVRLDETRYQAQCELHFVMIT
jgi:Tfp pilus assembly protein PilO